MIDIEQYGAMFDEALAAARALIDVPSVTPAQYDVVVVAGDVLGSDFRTECFMLRHDDDNGGMVHGAMFSYYGAGSDFSLCFAGHLDVVPPGNGWTGDPFVSRVESGLLVGRGAVDMKTSIACFAAAAHRAIAEGLPIGRISVLLTGDEEASSNSSMGRIVKLLEARDIKFDFCLVGEPTSVHEVGDTVKVGRRGSSNFELVINGKQGHVAYPDSFTNPMDSLPGVLDALRSAHLDDGTADFQPSHLVITNIDAGNSARNVVPASVSVSFNVRFNTSYTASSLYDKINEICSGLLSDYVLTYKSGAEPFLSEQSEYLNVVTGAISSVTGNEVKISTGGGTSDARFLYTMAPVVEFGPLHKTAHAVDEHISIDDLNKVTAIYYEIIKRIFVSAALA